MNFWFCDKKQAFLQNRCNQFTDRVALHLKLPAFDDFKWTIVKRALRKWSFCILLLLFFSVEMCAVCSEQGFMHLLCSAQDEIWHLTNTEPLPPWIATYGDEYLISYKILMILIFNLIFDIWQTLRCSHLELQTFQLTEMNI